MRLIRHISYHFKCVLAFRVDKKKEQMIRRKCR